MKKYFVMLCMFLPVAGQAQDYQSMDQRDMQMIQQQMQEIQACMAKVDRDQVMQLELSSRQLKIEIESLCASGKRDEAQRKAIAFGEEVANHAALKQMIECNEKLAEISPARKQMMPKISFTGVDKDGGDRHICDL